MRISFILVLLYFLTMSACINNHAKKESPSTTRQSEKIARICIDKKAGGIVLLVLYQREIGNLHDTEYSKL